MPNDLLVVTGGRSNREAALAIFSFRYEVLELQPDGTDKQDWTICENRPVLIWPDNHLESRQEAHKLCGVLSEFSSGVKILDVPQNPTGWGPTEAFQEFGDWDHFRVWAKPVVQPWTVDTPFPEEEAAYVEPEPAPAPVVVQRPRPAPPTPQIILPAPAIESFPENDDRRFFAVPAATPTAVIEAPPAPVPIPTISIVDLDKIDRTDRTAMFERLGIEMSARGGPIMNLDNVVRLFDTVKFFKNLIWYDSFLGRYRTKRKPGLMEEAAEARDWADGDEMTFTLILQRDWGFTRIVPKTVMDSIVALGRRDIRNEPQEWMDELVWDGTKRLDDFLVNYIGESPSEYTKQVGRNMFVGMVARVYEPGCKLDNMAILEGKQGIFKSTALQVIGGKWFAECHEQMDSPEFRKVIQGKLLVELPELANFSKTDKNILKRTLTCRIDRFRASYGRVAGDYPRQGIFGGTTNEHAYLFDEENRRFWPVVCGKIDIDALRADRDQLFAEAVHEYKAGATWHEVPFEEAAYRQELRRHIDEWEEIVGRFLENDSTAATEGIEMERVAQDCLNIAPGRLDNAFQRRLGAILRKLDWQSIQLADEYGRKRRVWVLKGWTPKPPVA